MTMNQVALITGITGQDGSYLAELLLSKGYEVHGYTRGSERSLGCSQHLIGRIQVHCFDQSDQEQWKALIGSLKPVEFYHLAGDSFVPNSWKHPVANQQANAVLPLVLLEAIRTTSPGTRFLNASSREIFGNCLDLPLVNELTPMHPTTLYGIHKASSRWMVTAYRNQYDMFAASAILFNHESPRRSEAFVTRKITKAVAEIACGQRVRLELGSLRARRDWGFAGDFVEAMWRMLQIDSPEDFVLGTGELHSLQELVNLAFQQVRINPTDFLGTNAELIREHDANAVAADISKARKLLAWEPQVGFQQLISKMLEHDLDLCQRNGARAA